MSSLSICVLATLAVGCGKHRRRDLDSGVDPASELCLREPFKSTEACKGGILIRLNTCPRLSLTVTPTRIAPAGRALLTASVLDAEGNTVEQEWFADPDGTLDMDEAPRIYYECESVGRKTITLIATDEYGCESMNEIELSCIDATSLENAGSDPLPQP